MRQRTEDDVEAVENCGISGVERQLTGTPRPATACGRRPSPQRGSRRRRPRRRGPDGPRRAATAPCRHTLTPRPRPPSSASLYRQPHTHASLTRRLRAGWIVSPRASMATSCSTRRARVSARRAVVDTVEDGVPVGGVQSFERLGRRAGWRPGRRPGPRAPRWSPTRRRRRPTSRPLWLVDGAGAGRVHPPLGVQAVRQFRVPLRPPPAGPTGGEPSPERGVVPPGELPVDPTEADGFLEGLVVGQRRRSGRPLLGQDQPDAGRSRTVLVEPPPPGRDVGDQQLGEIGRHRTEARPLSGLGAGPRPSRVPPTDLGCPP